MTTLAPAKPAAADPPPPLPLQAPPPGADRLARVLAVLIFAALSVLGAVTSEGFLEADACTHYLYARYATEEIHYLVNVWGRPVCTGVYAIPALLGERLGVRLMSLALALGIAAATYRAARLQGYRWPALAFVFVLAQPLVFLHSFSELTELPFALMVAVAFLAYRERRWWVMALVVGAMPLARPEGFGFILLAAAALVLHRRPWWLPLLGLPLAIWSYGGWEIFGRPGEWYRWLPNHWPYAAESLYDPGHLLHFVALLPAIVGPLLFPATLLGAWRCLIGLPMTFFRSHEHRCEALIAILPLGILAGHSVLYALGKMASNGEIRYMLVVAPFWALLTARGWTWAWERLRLRDPLRWAGVAAMLPLLVNWSYTVLPLGLADDWQEARRLVAWYDGSGLRDRYPYFMAAHPGVAYFTGVSPTGPAVREWGEATVAAAPGGTLLIWDDVYGVYNSDAQRSVTIEEIEQAGWRPVGPPEGLSDRWRLYVSP